MRLERERRGGEGGGDWEIDRRRKKFMMKVVKRRGMKDRYVCVRVRGSVEMGCKINEASIKEKKGEGRDGRVIVRHPFL